MNLSGLRNFAHGVYKKAAETVTGPLTTSKFDEKRVITPDEFVAAGDFLVHQCPTWAWEGGDPKKSRSYLPRDKQFLVTRNVPCLKRATDMENYNPNAEFAVGGEDEWVATHSDPSKGPAAGGAAAADDDIPSIDDADKPQGQAVNDDDVPDISELDIGAVDDDAALPAAGSRGHPRAEEPPDNIMRTRTYDLYITYDQYYQVPRFWLVGFDETGHPLPAQKVLEDVSEEHARKTITMEPHPHLPISAASIHPCRHAEVMKRLVDNLTAANKEFAVEHYLVLFLKFIASVVPTIQYDFTMTVGH